MARRIPGGVPLLVGALVLIGCLGALFTRSRDGPARASALSLHVFGNRLLDGNGASVVLHGVNRSGSEYVCLGSRAFADGPTDRASLEAMKAWGLNAVRVPLNEDCWLGVNGATLGGIAYQQAVQRYVYTIVAEGMYAILDLHMSAPGTLKATGQQPMPDADHAPAFWRGVAGIFGANDAVLFDLFNEPYPQSDGTESAMWRCWRDGCQETSTQGAGYQAVGMRALVRVVRATGATNVIMLGGIRHAGDVSQWFAYKPSDPLRNLAVSQHFYYAGACSSVRCWDRTTATVATRYPLIGGEVGDTDCTIDNTGTLLPFLAARHVSYVGWDWGTNFGCQSLIARYDGTPSQPYGQWFHDSVLRAEGRPIAPGTLSAYFDNTGVGTDYQQDACGFDDLGYCYSGQALALAGLSPAHAIGYNGAAFSWNALPGQPDNLVAAGQTVAISPTVAGAGALNVLGAASQGPIGGTITLTYTDGATARATLDLSDWTLSGGTARLEPGNTILVTLPYRDRNDGTRQQGNVYLFAVAIPLDRGKTLASVRMPVLTQSGLSPRLHVFAISVTAQRGHG